MAATVAKNLSTTVNSRRRKIALPSRQLLQPAAATDSQFHFISDILTLGTDAFDARIEQRFSQALCSVSAVRSVERRLIVRSLASIASERAMRTRTRVRGRGLVLMLFPALLCGMLTFTHTTANVLRTSAPNTGTGPGDGDIALAVGGVHPSNGKQPHSDSSSSSSGNGTGDQEGPAPSFCYDLAMYSFGSEFFARHESDEENVSSYTVRVNAYDLLMGIPTICFLLYLGSKMSNACKIYRMLASPEAKILSRCLGTFVRVDLPDQSGCSQCWFVCMRVTCVFDRIDMVYQYLQSSYLPCANRLSRYNTGLENLLVYRPFRHGYVLHPFSATYQGVISVFLMFLHVQYTRAQCGSVSFSFFFLSVSCGSEFFEAGIIIYATLCTRQIRTYRTPSYREQTPAELVWTAAKFATVFAALDCASMVSDE